MSTAADTTGDARLTPATGLGEPRRLGFGRLLSVELRRLVDTVGGRWVIGLIILSTVLALVALWFVAETNENRTFTLFLQGVLAPQGLLLPVLGVLAATQEWTHRTALVTFTLEPRRLRVVVAKVVAAVLLGAGGIVAGVALAALFTLPSALGGATDAWTVRGWPLAGDLAGLVIGILVGTGFGLLFGVTWIALVVYFALPTILAVLELWEPAARVLPWVNINSAVAPLSGGVALTATQWQQLATSIGVWIVLPLAVGALLTLRREVK